MALSVDSICTDLDLANQVGGVAELDRINKNLSVRDAFRQGALDDALAALASRVPPIYDNDLSDPRELRLSVCYRALSKLYGTAITGEDDRAHTLAKNYLREYQGAIHGRFTVGQSAVVGGGTFAFERR